eukprot:TRINITY_DN5078_c0_g1_i2.p1 TRINITY_DN5078_c0_g1~~TRINITY_DN5078_c0_g1_i2.p1  ORF type:complete len:685 (-),score=124.50 TRINITY_DN5078_c0_g1_i2:79-2133(-)
MNVNSDINTSSALFVLSQLLMSGPNSPFYQSLIESNLGSNYAPGSGYNHSTRETFFSIGLQGVSEENAGKIEEIVLQTLESVAQDGFDESHVEAQLHQVEISQRYVTSDFGLNLGANLTNFWIHGADPIEAIDSAKIVSWIREKIKEGNFFQDLIRRYFLDNTHRVTVIMEPDDEFGNKLTQEEKQKLEIKRKELTPEEEDEIIQSTEQLKLHQQQTLDPSVLPTIKLEDIIRVKPVPKFTDEDISQTKVRLVPQSTNGLVHLHVMININNLSDELLPYVPLFCQVLTNSGTKEINYRELTQQIEMSTGGFDAVPQSSSHPLDVKQYKSRIMLSSYCLENHVETMFSLWTQIFCGVNMHDVDRVKVLLSQIESDFQDMIMDNGHSFAKLHASSILSPRYRFEEICEGLTQYKFIQHLVNDESDEQLTSVCEKLSRIANYCLNKENLSVVVNTEDKMMGRAKSALQSFLNNIPTNGVRPVSWTNKFAQPPVFNYSNVESNPVKIFIPTPGQINHTSVCYPTVPYTNPDFVPLKVLAQIMSNEFLHKEIREKGGAYGSGCVSEEGVFGFYSYRDPELSQTLSAYDRAVDWAHSTTFSDDFIEQAKLNIFAQVDKPLEPGIVSVSEFATDISPELRQRNREILLNTGNKELKSLSEKYLAQTKRDLRVTTVLGPEESTEIQEDHKNE